MGLKRKGRITWYINPASILGTIVSTVATFKLLDIYSKKETGEGAWDGVRRSVENLKQKFSTKDG